MRAIGAKIRNQRKDALHKFTTALVNDYGAIFINNVSTTSQTASGNGKSVLDAGWGLLKTQLQYGGQAHQQGFAPEGIAFYTDDEITRNAQEGLHPGNCRAAWTQQLKGRIQQLARRLYDEDVWELVQAYLQGARIIKLKSHRNLVYNHRVDYLAKNAAYSLKASPREVVPYDDWLTAGFLRYQTTIPLPPGLLHLQGNHFSRTNFLPGTRPVFFLLGGRARIFG